MKYSVLLVSALSAFTLAAPAPTFLDKSCAHKKPAGHYADDYKGCLAYNIDEVKYKVKCIWYDPKLKHCKHDDKEKDHDKDHDKGHGPKKDDKGKDDKGKDDKGKDDKGKDDKGKDDKGKDDKGKDDKGKDDKGKDDKGKDDKGKDDKGKDDKY
ncbi:hypothetical protein OPT61_g7518 [Boeremia exigua]|uniref:Uncharacterized protein n=1 Tax=Boeremia exigua TaxID=749465 RepID=A0ACC2I2J2_9PLEO|nr:hypothetical protein OPT61_g7518 [Boeremia exigua]